MSDGFRRLLSIEAVTVIPDVARDGHRLPVIGAT